MIYSLIQEEELDSCQGWLLAKAQMLRNRRLGKPHEILAFTRQYSQHPLYEGLKFRHVVPQELGC